MVSYLSKVVYFDLSHLHFTPPFEFRRDIWHPKTRLLGLSCV